MFQNETELKAAIKSVLAGTMDVSRNPGRIPFDLLPLADGRATVNGAVGMARVILAGLDDRRAIADATDVIARLTTGVDAETIREAVRFERVSIRGMVRDFADASERFALATGRTEERREARRYNVVGAGRKLCADDTETDTLSQITTTGEKIRYLDLPRYTEEQARMRNMLQDSIAEDRRRERVTNAEEDAHKRALAFALGR